MFNMYTHEKRSQDASLRSSLEMKRNERMTKQKCKSF